MIIRSRIIVPVFSEPIENGAVAIRGNKIVDVGRFEDVRAGHSGDVIDLGERVLLPGLINAHCHLDYTALRGRIAPQRSFTDWVRSINELKASLRDEDYLKGINEGLAEAQRFGTTTLVNLEAFPSLLRRIQPPAIRVWWCAEMIDVRTPVPIEQITVDLQDWFQSHPELRGGIGLAPHAPYTASARLYSDSSALGRKHGLLLTTHVAESNEEMAMFRDASGPLYEFLKGIGRPMDDCGNKTPIALLIRTQRIDERWIVAHLNEITEGDFGLLQSCGKFHVVHCPSSHAFFGHAPFPLRRLQKFGFNVCLGTDSLASNSNLSLFSEMRKLLEVDPSISPREAVEMVTANAARAIGSSDSFGQLRPGFTADLVAVSLQSEPDPFAAVVAFEDDVDWMMVDGQPMGRK